MEKSGFHNFLCLGDHNFHFAEKSYEFWKDWPFFRIFDRFLEILNFLQIFTIKSEMKTAIVRNGCDNCFCGNGDC